MDVVIAWVASRFLLRLAVYVGFAAAFFQSGLEVTTLLVEPERFAGGLAWAWVAIFPLMLAGFFVVNRRFGCVSGACSARRGAPRFPAQPGA